MDTHDRYDVSFSNLVSYEVTNSEEIAAPPKTKSGGSQ